MRLDSAALSAFEKALDGDAPDQVATANLVPNPDNPRSADEERRADSWPEFVASLLQYGILEPLLVTPPDSKGRSVVVRGHRRLYGALDAGLVSVPVRFVDSLADSRRPLSLLLDNHHRAGFDPYEEAHYLAREMKAHGLSQTALCELGNLKKTHVSARLLLCELSKDEYLAAKQLGLTVRDIEQLARDKKQSPSLDVAAQTQSRVQSKQLAQRTASPSQHKLASPEGLGSKQAQAIDPKAATLAWIEAQAAAPAVMPDDARQWRAWLSLVAKLKFKHA